LVLEVLSFRLENNPKSFTIPVKFWTDDRLSQNADRCIICFDWYLSHYLQGLFCLPNYTVARIYGRGRLVKSLAIPIKFWTDDRLSQKAVVSLCLCPWFQRRSNSFFNLSNSFIFDFLIELDWVVVKTNKTKHDAEPSVV